MSLERGGRGSSNDRRKTALGKRISGSTHGFKGGKKGKKSRRVGPGKVETTVTRNERKITDLCKRAQIG